ncbi:hypothetical protein K469DRAFT_736742 [Zopfia rhizophila CBS 207.26]|uniref:Carboxymuconolactone decarboxylase-like domain-containing protein n=1 Tax=Zopfia rhizophila CBS 207.26 TaxID=1314779 RepID=A0A6A6EFE7_9PEZI|nr:hypothetical protein K469DRAFT_736742 [Zopfia rhizophila CBS 207.26]
MPPSNPRLLALFENVQSQFPTATLGEEKWFLVVLSALTGIGKPNLAADLYLYLTQLPQYSTSGARQILIRRLREVLVKSVSIIGVCRPLEAIFCIDAVTKEEDKEFSYSRQDWKCDEANHQRGTNWLMKLYGENLKPIDETFDSHRDFGWISREITYGLYLSDHHILDGVETELVVLSGIMVQDLPKMTAWHLRACRRIGISMEDCEGIQKCIELVVDFADVKLSPMPRAKDIEHEV